MTAIASTSARAKNERERIVGKAEIDIAPTRHFREQYRQRVGRIGGLYQHGRVRLAGTLVKSPCGDRWFLDVQGIGRIVLRRTTAAFVGVTVLPTKAERISQLQVS